MGLSYERNRQPDARDRSKPSVLQKADISALTIMIFGRRAAFLRGSLVERLADFTIPLPFAPKAAPN
jgi:hypothetical protein